MNENEGIELLKQFVKARNKFLRFKNDLDLKAKYEYYQQICINKFEYIIMMHTYKYKKFANYNDLKQEGFIALISALRTYNPKKGNFYAWCHKYIGTKISREANKHSTIKIPLQKTKNFCPIKVTKFPLMLDQSPDSFDQIETIENKREIGKALSLLPQRERKIIQMSFGVGGIKPHSINKISKQLNISIAECSSIRNEAIEILKKHLEQINL